MTARRALPRRRRSETHTIEVEGQEYTVTLGQYEDGTVGEIFLDSAKVGSQMDAILADAGILASRCIQLGVAPEQLAHGMTRTPIFEDPKITDIVARPASPVGVAIDLAATTNREVKGVA